MSAHLGPTEFVDCVEGTLSPERVRHVEACGICRQTADGLRRAMAAVDDASVPEPSPLFWDHFSARVRSAIDEEAPPTAGWRRVLSSGAVRLTAAAITAALVLIVTLWRPVAPPSSVATGHGRDAATETPGTWQGAFEARSDDIDADDGWVLVLAVADELEEAEISAAGIGTRPGSVELVAQTLTDVERLQLAELLEDEIRRATPPTPAS